MWRWEHLPPPVLTAIRHVSILKRRQPMNKQFGRLLLPLVTTLAAPRAITTVKQTVCIPVLLLSKQQVVQHQMQSEWAWPIPTKFTLVLQRLVDLRRHRMPQVLHGHIPIMEKPTGICPQKMSCTPCVSGHEISTTPTQVQHAMELV